MLVSRHKSWIVPSMPPFQTLRVMSWLKLVEVTSPSQTSRTKTPSPSVVGKILHLPRRKFPGHFLCYSSKNLRDDDVPVSFQSHPATWPPPSGPRVMHIRPTWPLQKTKPGYHMSCHHGAMTTWIPHHRPHHLAPLGSSFALNEFSVKCFPISKHEYPRSKFHEGFSLSSQKQQGDVMLTSYPPCGFFRECHVSLISRPIIPTKQFILGVTCHAIMAPCHPSNC